MLNTVHAGCPLAGASAGKALRAIVRLTFILRLKGLLSAGSQLRKGDNMAKNRSAIKRAELSKERAVRNASQRSAMKTAIRKFEEALKSDQATLDAAFNKATRLVDKAAAKGIVHPNTRDHKKAQLARKFQSKTNASTTA
jgi:small subunit ribosomal protein S20